MQRLWIIKTGTTFPETARQYGDFDKWTRDGLGMQARDAEVVDVQRDEPLPDPAECTGVVITGAHEMVTDRLPWSLRVQRWIPQLLAADVPLLGICYGHQLLAQATGGRVGYHPAGREIGTVPVHLQPDRPADPLFDGVPPTVLAHVVHAQSVLQLPLGAVWLAWNEFEPHHAYRLGEHAWGVQFHPEYDSRIMKSYIRLLAEELSSAHRDVQEVLDSVQETPVARGILQRFAEYVRSR